MSTTIFNGTSRYASDFQSVITRAVNIASLPITQLSQQKQKLQDQSTALTALQTTFTSLQSSLSGLATATNKDSTVATSSDYNIAQSSVTGTVQAGAYKLNITDLGSYSAVLSGDSLTKVADPSSGGLTTANSVTLTVNGVDTVLNPASTSMNDLVSSINGANAGVQATIVNLGSSSSPDYRLSLESTKLGAVTIGLSDGTTNLLGTQTTGALASYTLNGLPAGGISTDSRNVTLSPGLSATLTATGNATITVTTTSASLNTALSTFIAAYNNAVDALDKQRGRDAGALSGDSIISTLSSAMRQVVNYTSPSGMSLTDLGVSFDDTGHLKLDSTVVSGLSATDMQNASDFLGSATTGGFLKNATDTLSGVADATSGVIQTSVASLKTSINDEQAQIDTTQKRVDDMQTDLQNRMAAADALIAQMEQKVTYFTSLFQAYLDSIKSSN